MRFPLIVMSLAAVPAAVVHAQDSSAIRLDEIVVTATRVEIAAVTSSATVVTGDDIRRRGITRVADALRELAGVTVVETGSMGGLTSLYVRGGESGYTRVMVDGVPVNAPGGEIDLAHLVTEDIDRIEIVRGPTSVLYGTDAVTGVIQIFTRRGGANRGSLTLSNGTNATSNVSASYAGSARGAQYGFSAGRLGSNGIHAFNNDYRNVWAGGSVRLVPDERTSLDLVARYSDDRYGVPTDGSGIAVDRNAYQFGERALFSLDARRFVTGSLRIGVLLAAHSVDQGFDDQLDSPADTLGFYAYRSLNHVVRRSGDLRADYYLTPDVVVTAGAVAEQQLERSFSDSRSEFGPSTEVFEARRWNRAAYAQLAGARGRFSWSVGSRLDDNDAFGSFVTARAGVALKAGRGITVRAAGGTAFREPSFFQNYAQGFVRGNPDLDPERSRSVELGVRKELLGERLALSVTGYHQEFRDMIEFTFAPPEPGDPNYFNIALARSRGAEFELAARAGVLRVRAQYSLVDTEVTGAGSDTSPFGLFPAGETLLRRPVHAASLTAGAVTARGSVTATLAYTGASDDIDYTLGQRVTLDDRVTIDLAGSATVLEGRRGDVAVEARVTNLLDAAYETVVGFRAPGRQITAGIRAGI